jgi:4-hydroxythreonine-4-phosphate dehydrogenase
MKPVIAITMGDPGGVGPEILLKSLKAISAKNVTALVIGRMEVFEFAKEKLKLGFDPHIIYEFSQRAINEKEINFLDITKDAKELYEKLPANVNRAQRKFVIGEISPWNGTLAYTAIKVASDLANKGLIKGIVTLPINKTAVRYCDSKFIGHTEFFAQSADVEDCAMMFVSPHLKVTLATIHIPLKKVSQVLNTDNICAKIRLTHEFLKKYSNIKNPKIGVCALNPHGREFGREEERVILPAVEKMKRKGIDVSGPLPGDQIFYQGYKGRFDAIVSMYHDQGLAPFKMIAFHDGVNVTLGLPYLRTSPDHGTAFDIAYQNKANPASFRQAFQLIAKSLN